MTGFAERYEAVLVPVIFRPWAEEIMRRVPPRAGERVLDLACGTGVLTRRLAGLDVSVGELTGIDMSADMLGVARAEAGKAGLHIDWIEASADTLPLTDGAIDLAYCQQALQFFPDRPRALRELKRVMVAGGRVAFSVQRELDANPLLRSQAAALDKHVGVQAGDAVRAICRLSDADEIRGLFADAGFTGVEVESVSLTLHHQDGRAFAAGAMGGMHTGDKLSTMSEGERQLCIDDFLTGLGDGYDGASIRFPHVSHVVTAAA